MNRFVSLLAVSLLAAWTAWGTSARAEPPASASSPIGFWKTIDDEDGTAKSVVQIWEHQGTLFGKIVKLFRDPEALCDKCEGPQKGKPVMGMRIMKNLKKDGDEWSGGRITDPENGKTYKCYIAVEDGGKKLKVRGYIGISLIGRTQYWERVSAPSDGRATSKPAGNED